MFGGWIMAKSVRWEIIVQKKSSLIHSFPPAMPLWQLLRLENISSFTQTLDDMSCVNPNYLHQTHLRWLTHYSTQHSCPTVGLWSWIRWSFARVNYDRFSRSSPRVSRTKNGGTVPYKAILGLGFPYISRIHTDYIGFRTSFRYLKCLVSHGNHSWTTILGDGFKS